MVSREPPEEKAEEQVIEKMEVVEEEKEEPVSLSPKEVLQTRVFYKIWLGQFAIALAQVDLLNFYTILFYSGPFVELEENLRADLDHLRPLPCKCGDPHLPMQWHLQDNMGAPL